MRSFILVAVLAATIPAARAETFGEADIEAIYSAYTKDPGKFDVTYKNRPFVARMPLTSLSHGTGLEGWFAIFGQRDRNRAVSCSTHASLADPEVAQKGPGDVVEVRGNIGRVLIGAVDLDGCNLYR